MATAGQQSDDKSAVERLLKVFEAKVEASTRICNMQTLQSMLQSLKERPKGRVKINSIRVLREIVQEERERIVSDFSASYQPDPVLKFFDWFFQFWEYLKEIKRQFDEKVYRTLQRYYMSDGFTPTPVKTPGSRSSLASTSEVELRFSPGADVLRVSQDSNRSSISYGHISQRLKEEFHEVNEIYDNSEIKSCANAMVNVSDSWRSLLIESREIQEDIGYGSMSSSGGSNTSRDISGIISLISEVLLLSQKSASIARKWLDIYSNKSRRFHEKLKKINELQDKLSSKLKTIKGEMISTEDKLNEVTDKLDKLVKREERVDDLQGKIHVVEENERIVNELLDLANRQRHEIAQMMLDTGSIHSDRDSQLKLRYEENKLKRYILDKKLKALAYNKEVLKSDYEMELSLKPTIIRHTNDTQEACEKMEENLEKNRQLMRDIEAALGPLQSDKEYLELELELCPPPPPPDVGDFQLGDINAASESYDSTPEESSDIGSPGVDVKGKEKQEEAPQNNEKLDKSNTNMKTSKTFQGKNVEHPPWQFTFKPTTLGKIGNSTTPGETNKPQFEQPKQKVRYPHYLKRKIPKPKNNQKTQPYTDDKAKSAEHKEQVKTIPPPDNNNIDSKEATNNHHPQSYLTQRRDNANQHADTENDDSEEEQKTIRALIRLPAHTLLPSEVQQAFPGLREDTFTRLNKMFQYYQHSDEEVHELDRHHNAKPSTNTTAVQPKPKSILKNNGNVQSKRSENDSKPANKILPHVTNDAHEPVLPDEKNDDGAVSKDILSDPRIKPMKQSHKQKIDNKNISSVDISKFKNVAKDKSKAEDILPNNSPLMLKNPTSPFGDDYRVAAKHVGSTKKALPANSIPTVQAKKISIPKYKPSKAVPNTEPEDVILSTDTGRKSVESDRYVADFDTDTLKQPEMVEQNTKASPRGRVRFDDIVDVVADDSDGVHEHKCANVKQKGRIHRKGSSNNVPWYQLDKVA